MIRPLTEPEKKLKEELTKQLGKCPHFVTSPYYPMVCQWCGEILN